MDIPKLVFQTLMLIMYLRKGLLTPLSLFYLVLLLINWMIAYYRFQNSRVDHNLIISRCFYL